MNIKIINNCKTDDLTWKVGDYFFNKKYSEVYIVARDLAVTLLVCLNDGGFYSNANMMFGTFSDLNMNEQEWIKLNNVKIEVS